MERGMMWKNGIVHLFITSLLMVFVLAGGAWAKKPDDPNSCGSCSEDKPGDGPPIGSSVVSSLETTLTGAAASSSSNTKTFRTDSGPELDLYQPCNGGDNEIDFNINVHDVNTSSITSATLTLAVWDVDYDCGPYCCERDSVYINGHRLTRPGEYLTGANGQWSTVSFNVDPSWIVDGDNYVQIFIDLFCPHPTWCVTCDWGELSLELGKTPEIEDIEIVPDNPETTKDVTFTAKLKNMDGYEVVKIAWSGDIKPWWKFWALTGNPLTVKPAAGTHGKDKNVTATLKYKKTDDGETGTHSMSKEFDLFFAKMQGAGAMADDDGDGTANWYEYWSSSKDGACSFNAGSSKMHYGGGGPSHSTRGEYWSGNIRLYDSAAMNCSFLSHPAAGISISQQGIDCVEVVLRHEQEHGNVDLQWESGGDWNGLADSDSDELPDTVEQGLADFNDNNAVSFPGFCCGDDEEVYNTQVAQNQTGTSANDWANPGKNSKPSYLREIVETGTQASLSGVYLDWLEDSDSDGLAEFLAVAVQLDVDSAGEYRVFANLYDSAGQVLWAQDISYLDTGEQVVTLFFDGHILRQRRINGPYEIGYIVLYGATFEEQVSNPHTTDPYAYTDFAALGSEITDVISECLIDDNSNGLAEYLNINVNVNVATAGDIALEAYLHAQNGTPISYANVNTNLPVGQHTLTLTFDGMAIRQSRVDGPYFLRSLTLFEGENRTDFIYEAYETSAYSYTAFEVGDAEFTSAGTFSDYGIDLDSDGLYDLLRIEVAANISQAGPYAVVGRLFDADGNSIDDVTLDLDLTAGEQTINLDFSGIAIWLNRENGPYELRYAFLYDSEGSLADSLPNAYATSAYNYNQFEQPDVALTGNYSDSAIDLNSDGVYEYLRVNVEVIVANAGNYALNARLMDLAENEIVWASTTAWLPADEFRTMQLNFNGPDIYSHGVNGPYYVRDVYVYKMSNTALSDYKYDAYVTQNHWPVANQPPIADAGPDQPTVERTSAAGAEVTLDGSESSDPDGDPITYEWTWTGGSASGINPAVTLPMGLTIITLTVSDGELSDTDTVHINVVDTTHPTVSVVEPSTDLAVQDGITLAATASDISGVDEVYFCIREPNDGNGVPIGQEDLAAAFDPVTGKWECAFDTTQLQDGYYVVVAKAVDSYGNEGWSEVVPFSIRNWAVVKLLPATPSSKAGRTMPVKFSIRIAQSVDPAMPFVYNEDLEIRIYKSTSPSVILQRSLFGPGATDYRIAIAGEQYITNFKTLTTPATYVVEIWRPAKNFKVGSFTFKTVK